MKSYYLFIVYFFILLVLFGSCNGSGSDKKPVLENFKNIDPTVFESDVKNLIFSDNDPIKIQITDWKKDHQLKLSTLFDSIEYVKLSNEPKAIIGDINKIVIHDTCIFILDRYKTKSLKKFSNKGNYLATIGRQGAGPEEYVEPTDFIIQEDEIIVSDQFKSDLKFYDLFGNFKYAKKVPFLFLKFSFFSPNRYVFHQVSTDGNNHLQSIANWLIFETDSTFHINNRGFFRSNNKDNNHIVENNFYSYKDKVFFHPTYNDTIYSISPNYHIRAEYIIDFPNGKLPERYLLKENKKELLKNINEGPYAIFSGNYVPTDDYLYLEYTTKNQLSRVLYSKKTNKIIIGSKVSNDINQIFQFNNIRTSTDQNVLVGYMQAYLISDLFGKYSRNEWVKSIGEKNTRIAESIKIEDNPIILFFKIKDF
ncbi:MAG: 6-bladed beta-propeller [Candidatus Azobacteroides sp.]|nr:6-bladed beta-propeller [Candidatus Azobacteroides sp.]